MQSALLLEGIGSDPFWWGKLIAFFGSVWITLAFLLLSISVQSLVFRACCLITWKCAVMWAKSAKISYIYEICEPEGYWKPSAVCVCFWCLWCLPKTFSFFTCAANFSNRCIGAYRINRWIGRLSNIGRLMIEAMRRKGTYVGRVNDSRNWRENSCAPAGSKVTAVFWSMWHFSKGFWHWILGIAGYVSPSSNATVENYCLFVDS